MRRLLMIAICLGSSLAANAELTLKEIRTASKDVLVAYFKSTVINANEVNTTNLASWNLNGQPVTAINKFVTEADACDAAHCQRRLCPESLFQLISFSGAFCSVLFLPAGARRPLIVLRH